MKKIDKYKNYHLIMDEVGIHNEKDIELIKSVAQKFMPTNMFWLAITYIEKPEFETLLKSKLSDFQFIKDELSLPLRNTASIVRQFSMSKIIRTFLKFFFH